MLKLRHRGNTLIIPQGTTWSHSWLVTDDDGEPEDLTVPGWRARAQVRRRPSASTALYEWDSDTANAELTEDGMINLTVEPADSRSWLWRRGVYELKLEDPDGSVSQISNGTVHVVRSVTR